MTRFEREISGSLGEFWKKNAQKELDQLRSELENGKITIDRNGVARNCIGRVLMSDLLEKLTYITDKVSVDATTEARELEVAEELAEYRRNARPYSQEQLAEMRAAFGTGTTVVNVFTGESYEL